MARSFQAVCKSCQHIFPAEEGGCISFELLRCRKCGRAKEVLYEDIWDTYLALLKGMQPELPELNGADWRTFSGEPITNREYRRRVVAKAGVCSCGGRFSFNAPLRCPSCGSDSVADDGSCSLLID
jgi:hypothetical protein